MLGATVRMATPVILAAMGGLVSFHAGILNVAMEGFMLVAAFTAVLGSYYAGSWALGVLAAILVCFAFSLLYAAFVVDLKADCFAIGFALNILATGATLYLVRALGEGIFNAPGLGSIPRLHLSVLTRVPLLDALVNNHSLLVYAMPFLVLLVYLVLYWTPFGLRLRAAGESPAALETAGVSVRRTQYAASLICGLFCGLAGAHLSLGYLSQFIRDMTAGRGFMALAAILVGRGHPGYTALVALVFGAFEALSIKLQGQHLPPQFPLMFPYAVTILAVVLAGDTHRPARHRRRRSSLACGVECSSGGAGPG